MGMTKLSSVLDGVEKLAVHGSLDLELASLSHDSRHVSPGTLFFAIPGSRTDGNRHVQQAIACGAVAVVSEMQAPPAPLAFPVTWVQVKNAHAALGLAADRFYGRPSRALKVVGITGTNGKTTTSYFLESILVRAKRRVGVLGTVNYRLDGRPVGKAVNTTPIASELQRLLAAARDSGATDVVMEVSSHALSLHRVDDVVFDVAVFTNLFRDHLDFHKTREAYFAAKRRLFEMLEEHLSVKPDRFAVFNADDPWLAKLEGSAPHARWMPFGLGPAAALRGESVELTPGGTAFELVSGPKRRKIRLKLLGKHNVYNALAAAAAARALGVDEEAIIGGLEALDRVPGRLEPVEEGQGFQVLVDYAHTDSALETVLALLAEVPHKRVLTVFGCGGDRDRSKRGPMGLAACRGSDFVFVTSDNPRTEEPQRIVEDIVAGLDESRLSNYRVVLDRREAIRAAIREAADGDILLIAGKGHEDYQILKDRTIPFDDRAIAREALRERQKV
jgi:UDP-N-acetylmuramoyl-L-alanyl-D-glutamate--2,6-diaminopimelate ligase